MTAAGSSPSILRRVLALRSTPPFDRLTETELTLIAEIAEPHHFGPGETAHAGDTPLGGLWVTIEGGLTGPDGTPAAPLNGLASLLSNAVTPALRAGPSGAQILVIGKGYFFTLTRECPAFVLGLLTGSGAPGNAS